MDSEQMFIKLFGDTQRLRTIIFFIDNYYEDISFNDVLTEFKFRNSIALENIINNLLEIRFIINTGKIEDIKYYKINKNSKLVKGLIKFNFELYNK